VKALLLMSFALWWIGIPASGTEAKQRILLNYDLARDLRGGLENDSQDWILFTNFQKPTGQEVFERAQALRTKWSAPQIPSLSASLLANVYSMSAVRADISAEQRKNLTQWANEMLETISVLPIHQADEVLYRFFRASGSVTFSSLLEREILLGAALQVFSRVEDYWPNVNTPSVATNADGRVLVRHMVDLYPPLPVDEHTRLTTIRDENIREQCADVLVEWNRIREKSEFRAWFGPQNNDRREGLLKDITNHINRAFTMTPADLAIVQASLEKHIPNPAFRERLVLAAYKGTNPFAVPVQGEEGTAKIGPRRAKADSKQVIVAKAVGTEGTQSVSIQPAAAVDSVPLATASGHSAGRSLLWLTFAGAITLIILLLWRARARGASGEPK
jgi:hypothetical protein